MPRTRKSEVRQATVSTQVLASMGGGKVAYIKAMRSEDVNRIYPNAPPIEPGLDLFALLAADGSPVLIADSWDAVFGNAWENDLKVVAIH